MQALIVVQRFVAQRPEAERSRDGHDRAKGDNLTVGDHPLDGGRLRPAERQVATEREVSHPAAPPAPCRRANVQTRTSEGEALALAVGYLLHHGALKR